MSESPGVLIGLSNVLTHRCARTPAGPDADADGRRDWLRVRATRALEGREAYIQDAVVLGRRLRLFSNSHHLADFWRENFPSEAEWRARTGRPVPREPALTVYAAVGVAGEPEASYVSSARREVFLFNTSYYGDLRASALEALGPVIAPGSRLVHGGAVEVNGRSVLLLYPKELIHPTPVWGLMELSGSRFLAEGWGAVDPDGRFHPVERHLYLRASFVESYPDYAARILGGRFENVPASPSAARRQAAGPIIEAASRHDPRGALRNLPEDRAAETVLRLVESPDARVLVDPAVLFGRSLIVDRPSEISVVFALKTGTGEALRPTSLEGFDVPAFEVSVGAIQGHPREIARLIARQ
jgi:hypothetical protein